MRKGTKTRFNQPGMVLTREGLCQDGVDEVCVSVGAGNCFLLGGLVDGGDEAVSTPLSPLPPRWRHSRICRLTCFLRRPRETGKSHQVTSGMYRPVPTCPITANYFSEKNLKDVLQWECKTS